MAVLTKIVELPEYIVDVEAYLNQLGVSGYSLVSVYNGYAYLTTGAGGSTTNVYIVSSSAQLTDFAVTSSTNTFYADQNVIGSVTASYFVGDGAYLTNLNIASNATASAFWATGNGEGKNFEVGDDVWIGDVNLANTMQVMGQQDPTQGYIKLGSGSALIGTDGTGILILRPDYNDSREFVIQNTSPTDIHLKGGAGTTQLYFGDDTTNIHVNGDTGVVNVNGGLNSAGGFTGSISYASIVNVPSGLVSSSAQLQLVDGYSAVTNSWTHFVISTANVNTSTEVITTSTPHGFSTGSAVVYTAEGGTTIGGLSDGGTVYVRPITSTSFTLYGSAAQANAAPSITGLKNLTSTGNNNQRITSATALTVAYDTTNNTVVFTQLQGTGGTFGNLTANFTNTSLSNGQSITLKVITTNNTDTDYVLSAVQLDGSPITVFTVGPDLKINKNKTTILDVTLVKTGGTTTAYVQSRN